MKKPSGLLARFLRDTRGNALMLMAAGLIPLLGALGLAVDLSRAYLTKTKMQEAVDSAALAGRRAMTGDDVTTAKPDATSYFKFNFHDGQYGTTPVTLDVTKPDIGEVQVTATTTLPATIMTIFGVKPMTITTTGIATENFSNVDIMLVLDTTGSMDDYISDGKGGQVKKLDALKSAVQSLYTQLLPAKQQLESQGLQMRIGILPYAATVNVGPLVTALNKDYIQQANVPFFQWHDTKTTSRNRYGQTVTTDNWAFGQQRYNLSNYVNGGQLGDVDGNGDFTTSTWGGCIEERQTDPTITSGAAPTAAAYDLDIDMIPTSDDATKWKPYIYDVSNATSANGAGPNTYCPAAATGLTVMAQSDLTAALSKLQSRGSTYHDIGMIWGVRMMSSKGIFAATNPDVVKDQKVQRYIIFMSDGQMSAPMNYCSRYSCNTPQVDHVPYYSGYGLEGFDHRVGATSDDDSNNRHTTRFLMACNAAKGKGISVWTVAFGTGPVDSLTKCATSSDQAFVSASSQDLTNQFTSIGKSLGPLRIAK